jgi:hypothetical protein
LIESLKVQSNMKLQQTGGSGPGYSQPAMPALPGATSPATPPAAPTAPQNPIK